MTTIVETPTDNMVELGTMATGDAFIDCDGNYSILVGPGRGDEVRYLYVQDGVLHSVTAPGCRIVTRCNVNVIFSK